MYENIKAQLCIMPGETHFAPASNPKLFNEIVNRFLEKPFKDQIPTLQNGRNNCI
jgi:pimeloyl-ACP methyl ester carboxylesterase